MGLVIAVNTEFLFLFVHLVEQNSDGKLDLIIREGLAMNASGSPEVGTSAWLEDDDFDGLVDRCLTSAPTGQI